MDLEYSIHQMSGDFASAQQVLDDMEFDFELTEQEEIEKAFLIELNDIKEELYLSDLNTLSMVQIDQLYDMMETPGTHIHAEAIGLLVKYGLEYPREDLDFSMPSKHAPIFNAEKLVLENELKIYPNPASDFFILSGNNELEELEVIITDVSGKAVLTEKWKSIEKMVVISNLSKGLYLVRIIGDQTFELIVN